LPASLATADLGFVIAADGGAAASLAYGVVPDLVVGDLDSLAEEVRLRLEGETRIERHPAEKDKTDFELALDAAFARRPRRLSVVGSATGRLDHLFGMLTTLAARTPPEVEVDVLLGEATGHVVRGTRVLRGEPGELVSLFALEGDAEGVETSGLRYPLRDETLKAGTSHGVSNVFEAERSAGASWRTSTGRSATRRRDPCRCCRPSGRGAAA
jgi:thiamine pyrophosphokinase